MPGRTHLGCDTYQSRGTEISGRSHAPLPTVSTYGTRGTRGTRRRARGARVRPHSGAPPKRALGAAVSARDLGVRGRAPHLPSPSLGYFGRFEPLWHPRGALGGPGHDAAPRWKPRTPSALGLSDRDLGAGTVQARRQGGADTCSHDRAGHGQLQRVCRNRQQAPDPPNGARCAARPRGDAPGDAPAGRAWM